MNTFPKDILVVDFEVTGFDLDNDQAVQIGLVILDRETLEEKHSFMSWINPNMELSDELPGFAWADIKASEIEKIQAAPSLREVAEQIKEFLPNTYVLCAWNATFDFIFWRKLLKSIDMDRNSARVLDLWSLAAAKLINDPQYTAELRSEEVFQYFGATARTRHDALEDARIEAMVLRKIME